MTYPATVTFEAPEKVDNWRPLVQWIMAIPHMIVSYALSAVSNALAFVSWFIVLFTGRLPAGIANFQAMALRYNIRLEAYAGFMHAEYPPFEFPVTTADPGGQPIRVDFEPQLEDRNRLTVALRIIWAIPAILFTVVIAIVAVIMWILAFFAILFTGKWPAAMLDWVMKLMRVGIRLEAYMFMLTDEYPPFETD